MTKIVLSDNGASSSLAYHLAHVSLAICFLRWPRRRRVPNARTPSQKARQPSQAVHLAFRTEGAARVAPDQGWPATRDRSQSRIWNAHVLIASKYLRAGKLAARLKVLQAAQFMISVLEMIPFAAARTIGVVASSRGKTIRSRGMRCSCFDRAQHPFGERESRNACNGRPLYQRSGARIDARLES